MPRVEVSETAREDLARLIATLSLPHDTRERLKRSLRPLERFPELGAQLRDRWEGFRFILGPWRWMLIVYVFGEEEDRVVVVTTQDGRSSRAAPGDGREIPPASG